MARIGYACISTLDQDLDLQLARLKAEGCAIIRAEKVSGGLRKGRAELTTIIEFLRHGDVQRAVGVEKPQRSGQRRGFFYVLVERPFDGTFRRRPEDDPAVPIFGVDNALVRSQLEVQASPWS